MGKEITNLQPQLVWKHFYDLTNIPRPSKYEKKVIEHIKKLADHLNLESMVDEAGNLLVRIPPRHHSATDKTVILQAHVDMVPQKNNHKIHDFINDPIETRVEGEWVMANETTLGADNGIGAASMMALMEAKDLKHGPIEALFTINEEAGMDGAFGLRDDLLKGRSLINLDSEEYGELFIGCAGGIDAIISMTCDQDDPGDNITFIKVEIKGLKGGHSGLDINLGRANSNKLMTQLLRLLKKKYNIAISLFEGGDMRNAIPREAHSVICVDNNLAPRVLSEIEGFEKECLDKFNGVENDLTIVSHILDDHFKVLPTGEADRLLKLLADSPNGVIGMIESMPDVVETSINLSIVKAIEGEVKIQFLIRSSSDQAKQKLADEVKELFEAGGAKVGFTGDYPGWQPDPDSYLLEKCVEISEKHFNRSPGKHAMHAGLECGIIGAKYPGMDMISMGPTIKHPHSPEEKVNIPSVEAFWKYLVKVLESID